MALQPRNNLTQRRSLPKRLPISAIVLALAFTCSLIQYIQSGEVRWITDSFRKIELTTKQLIGAQDTDQLAGMFGEYQDKASQTLKKLGEAQQSDEGLTAGGIVRSLIASRNGISGNVMGVLDGNTLKILDADRVIHKIRLSGIDAPGQGHPYNLPSSKHLERLVAGKDVFVEAGKKDAQDWVLGKVWVRPDDCPKCDKTLNVNHAQILAGMARWSREQANEQSPEDRGRYESAEEEARGRKLGMWAQ